MTDGRPLKIAIASGKGGTGKTLIAVNLASFLSFGQKILLVDLDVEEPNDLLFFGGRTTAVEDQFKMIPEWDESRCTLCGICTQSCNYHAVIQLGPVIAVFKELCHSCYACSELCPVQALPMQKHKIGSVTTVSAGDLTLMESRLLVGEEQAVPLINQTHRMIEHYYEDTLLQIFDCPPGTSCPMVAAVKKADYVILVTEPTPFGLNDLKLAAETVQGLGSPYGVIINRDGIGDSAVEDYCHEHQVPILARIPYDIRIATLYSKGELVYDQVEGFREIFEKVMNQIDTVVCQS